jgi:hypothetical protein
MTTRGRLLVVAAMAGLALGSVGCGSPLDILRAQGTREWIIPVENMSARPVVVAVAVDAQPMGKLVGTAVPAVVPPRTTTEVVFSIPPGDGWAIFVNTGQPGGPLILAADVPPDRAGKLPLTITVDETGTPSVSAPDEPGWFGR